MDNSQTNNRQSETFDFVKMTRDRFNTGSTQTNNSQSKIAVQLPFTKNFLKSYQEIYTKEEIDTYRHDLEILIKSDHPENVASPFMKWTDFHFPSYISDQIAQFKYPAPTAIQSQGSFQIIIKTFFKTAFPIILQGRDLIGIAQTGSGKTIAFLVPGLIHMRAQPRAQKGEGPIMLVLAPTRELAMQIHGWVEKFGLHSACLYGGVEKRQQEWSLMRGVDVVIATPGRIIDFIESGKTSLDRCTFLVIDEADRMLDMGFEPQVRKIVDRTRKDRQTVFFSATWPYVVQQLAFDFCREDPVHIQVGHADISVNKDIKQAVIILDNDEEKLDELFIILENLGPDSKVLIFAQTKKECENLSRYLSKEGFFTLSLHGDKTQQERDYVMNELRMSRTRIVVATDVASRGLDVRDITHVINYDFPKQIEDYVHRIGRTGRAGDSGESISFIVSGQEDIQLIKELVTILKRCQQEVPQELLQGGRQKSIIIIILFNLGNKNTNGNNRKSNNFNPQKSSYQTSTFNNRGANNDQQNRSNNYNSFQAPPQVENHKPFPSREQYNQQNREKVQNNNTDQWKQNSKPLDRPNTEQQMQRKPIESQEQPKSFQQSKPIEQPKSVDQQSSKPKFGFFNSKK